MTSIQRSRPDRRWRLVRARPDVVPDSLRRAAFARGGRRWRPSRRQLRVVSACTAVVLVLGLVTWLGLGTDLVGVRQITVTGSQIASPDEVRAVAAVPTGTPLLRVDTGAVARRVRTLPSVATVAVKRSFPHTLVITVTERVAVVVAAEPGGFAVLDASGVVFRHLPTPPAGVVLIRVEAPGPADPATLAALHVVAALTPQLRAALKELVATAPAHIELALKDGRTIRWGDASASDAKATVATALLDRAAHIIDVSVPDVATTS